jgi:nucleotide-binding universal stress UspA family protein
MNNTHVPASPIAFRHILFCTDFSPGADHAFETALRLALLSPDTQLTLLHVIPETEAQFWKSYIYEVDHVDAKAQHDIHAKIKSAYLSHLPAGRHMKIELRLGQAAEKVLALAQERGVDLIVVGREGGGRLTQALFGRTAEKIVRKARCPVLVIPHGS